MPQSYLDFQRFKTTATNTYLLYLSTLICLVKHINILFQVPVANLLGIKILKDL